MKIIITRNLYSMIAGLLMIFSINAMEKEKPDNVPNNITKEALYPIMSKAFLEGDIEILNELENKFKMGVFKFKISDLGGEFSRCDTYGWRFDDQWKILCRDNHTRSRSAARQKYKDMANEYTEFRGAMTQAYADNDGERWDYLIAQRRQKGNAFNLDDFGGIFIDYPSGPLSWNEVKEYERQLEQKA